MIIHLESSCKFTMGTNVLRDIRGELSTTGQEMKLSAVIKEIWKRTWVPVCVAQEIKDDKRQQYITPQNQVEVKQLPRDPQFTLLEKNFRAFGKSKMPMTDTVLTQFKAEISNTAFKGNHLQSDSDISMLQNPWIQMNEKISLHDSWENIDKNIFLSVPETWTVHWHWKEEFYLHFMD